MIFRVGSRLVLSSEQSRTRKSYVAIRFLVFLLLLDSYVNFVQSTDAEKIFSIEAALWVSESIGFSKAWRTRNSCPVPLQSVTSLPSVDTVLRSRFGGLWGVGKVNRKGFDLQKPATSRELSWVVSPIYAFGLGQYVQMNLVFCESVVLEDGIFYLRDKTSALTCIVYSISACM